MLVDQGREEVGVRNVEAVQPGNTLAVADCAELLAVIRAGQPTEPDHEHEVRAMQSR
jgi:hypothetical protein